MIFSIFQERKEIESEVVIVIQCFKRASSSNYSLTLKNGSSKKESLIVVVTALAILFPARRINTMILKKFVLHFKSNFSLMISFQKKSTALYLGCVLAPLVSGRNVERLLLTCAQHLQKEPMMRQVLPPDGRHFRRGPFYRHLPSVGSSFFKPRIITIKKVP